MLTPDVINAIRQFLARTNLQGQEVPAFNRVMMTLAHEENAYNEAQRADKAPGDALKKAGDGPA